MDVGWHRYLHAPTNLDYAVTPGELVGLVIKD